VRVLRPYELFQCSGRHIKWLFVFLLHSRLLEFTRNYDVYVIWGFSLVINDLTSCQVDYWKRVNQSVNLELGPMSQERQIMEEINFWLYLFLLNFSEDPVVIFSVYRSKVTLLWQAHNSSCPRFIVKQGQLSKTLAFSQSHNFHKPLHILVHHYFSQLWAFVFR